MTVEYNEVEHRRLIAAVKALYGSAKWTCTNLSDQTQRELWEAARDAAGIPKGTATKLGLNG